MKCEVVRDLLPLYDEKLCSDESAALVEEHIKTCAACKGLLENLPKTELPKADTDALKPFVKVKRKLRTRIVGLITLGAVLLAVLIPVGYLTVNQIFHCGGADFEDLIYKHEARQFGEMLAEGRMEEFVELLDNTRFIITSDGASVQHKEFYLEKLKAAYENVKKYNPRVGEIYSSYSNHFWREQFFYLEFTRADGSEYWVRIDKQIYDNSKNGIPMQIPVETSKLYGIDPEKSNYENYSDMEDYSSEDLREICAFINTLYLADGGDFDIKLVEKFLQKPTPDALPENAIDVCGHLIAIRFDVSDYKAVYNGFVDFKKSNYTLDAAIGSERLDTERDMLYYPVMLIGSDGERQAAVSIKLYFDEYGLHSPRPEDIRGITNGSDLEIKLAGIFG